MNNEEFYGSQYKYLKRIQRNVYNILLDLKEDNPENIMYVTSRLKAADSALEKLNRKNIDYSELYTAMHDIIGFRIICPFISDVFKVVQMVKEISIFTVISEKNYINNPKPNGYQSYHIIVQVAPDISIEIQIRTIALDFWCALEHKLKYKKNIPDEEKITTELKTIMDNIVCMDRKMEEIKQIIDAANE